MAVLPLLNGSQAKPTVGAKLVHCLLYSGLPLLLPAKLNNTSETAGVLSTLKKLPGPAGPNTAPTRSSGWRISLLRRSNGPWYSQRTPYCNVRPGRNFQLSWKEPAKFCWDGVVKRGVPAMNPEVGEVWLKPSDVVPSRPVTRSKTLCAFVRSPEPMPPRNLDLAIPSGLEVLLPNWINCGIVLLKELLDRIHRHSPVNCILWWPFTQL